MHDWIEDNDFLTKHFFFPSFPEAVTFVTRIGFAAEKLNHHPEIELLYKRVNVRTQTHSAGHKVTEKDTALSQAIDAIANSMTLTPSDEGCDCHLKK